MPTQKPAPPDLSKIPTVKAIEVQFHTNDDDKDGDTALSVSFSHNNSVFAGTSPGDDPGNLLYGWNGVHSTDFEDNATTPWSSIPILSPVQKDLIHQCTTTVRIDPNGNDTWRFNYWVRLHYTDGTMDEYHYNGHALSEKVRENTFPLK